MKKVSVIVITHNGKKYLKECFESLAKQTYKDFNVYLLDNGSTDDSSDFVKENFPWVKIIRFNKNYGFAKGYNRAIAMVNTEYIALLNDDTKVDSKWLEELVKVIESDKSIFAVGSKIMFYDKPNTIQHAGAKITLIGAGIDIGFGESNSSKYNIKRVVGAVCGAAMLIRKDIFKRLGGFDESYFAYFEDVDLCWRAWLSGYKVLYVPTSIVYHKFGGSYGKRDSPKRTYYGQKNRFANLIKNFEIQNVFKGFAISIPYEFVRAVVFLVKYKSIKNIIAIFKGTVDALLNINYLVRKRKVIQSKRKINDKTIKELGIILPFKESIHEYFRLISVKF